jgi:hypothetical protein
MAKYAVQGDSKTATTLDGIRTIRGKNANGQGSV